MSHRGPLPPAAGSRLQLRPTLGAALPFAAPAALGLAVAAAPPYQPDGRHALELVLALPSLLVLAWLVMQTLRRTERSWVDPTVPCLMFLVVALLRDATGGAGSGLAPLLALPVCWLAVFGTRRDLVAGAALGLATLLLPLWLVGAPDYPPGEWRRAVLWAGIGAALAVAARQVVRELAGPGRETAREVATEVPVETVGVPAGREQRSAGERRLAGRLDAVMRGALLAGLVTTDEQGVVTSFGAGAAEMCGRSESETLGRPLTELLDDPLEMAELADQLGVPAGFPVLAELARLRAPSRSWVCRRADDEPIVVRLGISELRADGELTGYLAVALDETEAVRTRQELTLAEARWRVLMDHLPDTIMLLVEEGAGITLVTGAGLLAHHARGSAGRWLQDLAERSGVPIEQMLDAAFGGREETSETDALVDGREHEVVVSPLPARAGRAQALVMLRDVSRDRRRERAITTAKERAERLFEDAPQGIVLLGRAGEVVRANPATRRLLGRDDLVGWRLAALSYTEDDTTVPEHLEELLSGRASHPTAQWSVCRADGGEVRVVLSSTLLVGEDGDEDLVLTNLVDVSERYRHEQQLAHLADHDPLTGLANRRRFDSELARHVDECRRYGARGALLMLDLDRFKAVNDSLGHAAGDELLRMVGEVLRGRLRRSDVVARLGGDEFAVLLTHADREAAEVVARSIVEETREQLAALADSRGAVTVSVGGVLVESADLGPEELVSRADAAMYAAKAGGRDQYVVLGADPAPDPA